MEILLKSAEKRISSFWHDNINWNIYSIIKLICFKLIPPPPSISLSYRLALICEKNQIDYDFPSSMCVSDLSEKSNGSDRERKKENHTWIMQTILWVHIIMAIMCADFGECGYGGEMGLRNISAIEKGENNKIFNFPNNYVCSLSIFVLPFTPFPPSHSIRKICFSLGYDAI